MGVHDTHSGGQPDHENTFPERHPSTQHMMEMLRPNPNLPKGKPADISDNIWGLANRMIDFHELEDGPELTSGLRKLLEAKDCLVRAAVFGTTVDYRDR